MNSEPPLRLMLLAITTWLAACVSVPSQDQIQLSPAGDQHWNVIYRFSRPTSGITLVRTPNEARSNRWKFTSPDFEIIKVNDEDVIRRSDGGAFSMVNVLVPATYVPLPKDYAPFSPFSDGGLLIHSGRFQGCATAKLQVENTCDGPWLMKITPPKGMHIIVEGQLQSRTTQWLDSGDGTKVYVGTAKPSESSYFIGIVDSALPTAITEPIEKLLPQLMKLYAQMLPPLRQRPMLFVSYDASFSEGHGHQGGTLPDQVFMHFYGPGWEGSDLAGQTYEDTAWFFAHETGHLFQHSVTGVRDASWIHEGAAEAFAYLSLQSLKAVSQEYLDEHRQRALDGCSYALSKGTLASAVDRARFSDYYDCGLIMFLAIDAAVRMSSANQEDLFSFWTTLIAETGKNEPWEDVIFLEKIRHAIGPSLADRLRLVVSDDSDAAAIAVRQLLP